jgi:hypothetical protein
VLTGEDVIVIGRASYGSKIMFIITPGSCFRCRLERARMTGTGRNGRFQSDQTS